MQHRRRRVIGLLATLALGALTLAACGDESGTGSGSAPAAAEDAAFPRTVKTIRGDVVVESKPERVVVLDPQSADVVAALGVQPAVFDLASNDDYTAVPWLEGKLTGEFQRKLVGADWSADADAVLAARPDLIIGATTTITKGEVYDRLSKIAPTIAGVIEGVDPWQDRVRIIADALGIPEKGAEVIAATDAKFAAAKSQLAGLDGKTYNFIAYANEQGGFWYGNGDWLSGFGLKPNEGQDNTHKEFKVISRENVDTFDADVIMLWAMTEPDKQTLLADARFKQLPAATKNLVVWMDLQLATASNTAGPLSIGYTIDRVTPQLKAALG
jgi:iron complex transport system substrate-binding protein